MTELSSSNRKETIKGILECQAGNSTTEGVEMWINTGHHLPALEFSKSHVRIDTNTVTSFAIQDNI